MPWLQLVDCGSRRAKSTKERAKPTVQGRSTRSPERNYLIVTQAGLFSAIFSAALMPTSVFGSGSVCRCVTDAGFVHAAAMLGAAP